MCGSEGEIVGIIHVHSLWSEVGTEVASYHAAWVPTSHYVQENDEG